MSSALGKLDHVDDVAGEIDLEGALPQGGDVDPLDDTAVACSRSVGLGKDRYGGYRCDVSHGLEWWCPAKIASWGQVHSPH